MKTAGQAQHPTVSLCMIVKNEERWLSRCLESVRDVVDEIVVVDTGSEDSTPSIARSYGAIVVPHQWQDDFSAARNVSLDCATGEWVLMLDADEELVSEGRPRLRGLISEAEAAAYVLRVRNLLPAGDLHRYEDIHLTRLFRHRPEYRYEQSIHEQIRTSIERHGGKIVEAHGITILHHGYAQPVAQGKDRRVLRNLRMLEAALCRTPDDSYLQFHLGSTLKALGKRDEAFLALRRVLELDYPSLGDNLIDKLYMKLAQLALGSENYPLAVEYARKSLMRNPDNLASRYVAGLAHMFLGDVQKAYPHLSRLRLEGADNLVDTGDLDQVLDYCRQALGVPAS